MRNVRMLMSLGTMALAMTVGAIAVNGQATQTQPNPSQAITVTGCVHNETDVLKRQAVAGKVGMADEFVLTQATVKTAPTTAPTPEAQPKPPERTGTSGNALGKIYRVTGNQEATLKPHIGHRVEITGTFKSEVDARRELGAIGTTGKPPASPPEPTAMNTPEITINSIRMLSEACSG
jgi:hypothetical protein